MSKAGGQQHRGDHAFGIGDALRARPGLFEKGNLDRHGETSRAAIEQLIVVE